jgi:hypothetical protein
MLCGFLMTHQSIREFPDRVSDPERAVRQLTLIGRSITAVMGAGVAVAAYQMASVLWGGVAGIVAAIFTILQFPMFYFARTGNLDVPSLFWSALALTVFARVIRGGYTIRRGIVFGMFAALSAATKDQAAPFLVLLPLVMFLFHMSRQPDMHSRMLTWRPFAVTIWTGLITYSIASGFVFHPARYFAHLAWIAGLRPDSPVHYGYPDTFTGYVSLLSECARLIRNSLTLPIFVSAVAGIVLAAIKCRACLTLLIPIACLVFAVIFPIHKTEMRYMLPASFILACFAAYPFTLLVGKTTKRAARRLVWIAVGALSILPALRALELTHGMLRDSRYTCEERLSPLLTPESRIGFFGPWNKLPRLKDNASFFQLVPFYGTDRSLQYTDADIRAMAGYITKSRTEWIIVMPDHSSTAAHPYGTTCPNGLYELLKDGSLGYRIYAHFQTARLMSWLWIPPLDYPSVNPPIDLFARADIVQ